MLFARAGLEPGATVLVQGAGGGVATALILLGRPSRLARLRRSAISAAIRSGRPPAVAGGPAITLRVVLRCVIGHGSRLRVPAAPRAAPSPPALVRRGRAPAAAAPLRDPGQAGLDD